MSFFGRLLCKWHGKHKRGKALPNDRTRSMCPTCAWCEDTDGTLETSCGKYFVINEGTAEENDMKFCCYCGKPLVHHTFEWRDE